MGSTGGIKQAYRGYQSWVRKNELESVSLQMNEISLILTNVPSTPSSHRPFLVLKASRPTNSSGSLRRAIGAVFTDLRGYETTF